MDTLKQKILTIIEKNSRIDMKELAVLLGTGRRDHLRLSHHDRLGKDRY